VKSAVLLSFLCTNVKVTECSGIQEEGVTVRVCVYRVCECVESNLVAGWRSWTKISDGGRQPLMIWKIVRPAVALHRSESNVYADDEIFRFVQELTGE
jgi:hypothetical protein